jgi:hypothetical protein
VSETDHVLDLSASTDLRLPRKYRDDRRVVLVLVVVVVVPA